MGLFDRFRKPRLTTSVDRWIVRDAPGPLTVHQAWALVLPVVQAIDPKAFPTFITSGLDLDPRGQSFTWEFGFDLPSRRSHALLSIEPLDDGGAVDEAPLQLVQRIRPIAGVQRPALPMAFRGSPEVVSEFMARGVDFGGGPTDLKLETRVLPSGEAIWVTYTWDAEVHAPFSAGEP